MLPRFSSLLFAVSLVGAGCKHGGETEKRQNAQEKPATRPPPSKAEPNEAVALVETWRLAQENLDFGRYAALYDADFRGVKRVGDARYRFDRKGWLADRKVMFKPGLKVRVDHLEVTEVDGNVVAGFTQTFVSPGYRDVGRKVLVIERTEEGPRIVREELLTSIVEGGGGSVRALPGFFFAREDAVVLRSEIPEAWLTPSRRALSRAYRAAADDPDGAEQVEETFLTNADVVLPAEVTAFRDKTLHVTRTPRSGASELPPPCEARVARIEVVNTAKPSFESVRAVLKYGHVYGSVVLGVFERPCPGALWASETPPGRQFLPQKVSGPFGEVTRGAFRAEPEYRAKQTAFERQSQSGGRWDEGDGAIFEAFVFGDEAGVRLIHALGARGLWTESFTSLAVLFEVRSGTSPQSLGAVGRDAFLTPHLAFDLDDDGKLELLASESDDDESWYVMSAPAGQAEVSRVYFSPNFVCGG